MSTCWIFIRNNFPLIFRHKYHSDANTMTDFRNEIIADMSKVILKNCYHLHKFHIIFFTSVLIFQSSNLGKVVWVSQYLLSLSKNGGLKMCRKMCTYISPLGGD